MSMDLIKYAKQFDDVFSFISACLSVNNKTHWTKTRELAKVYYRANQ